ncbi:MAG: DUF4157 domain-containing protein [Chthoniobacterales bacterium]
MIAPPIVQEALLSPGEPLSQTTRKSMESRFGHDFSTVRVHTDERAARAAAAIDARAFAINRDIVFGAHEFQPQSVPGRRLLLHELTHVAQRTGSGSMRPAGSGPLPISDASAPAEQEASRVASKIMSDGSVPRLSSQISGAVIHRQPATTRVLEAEASAPKDSDPLEFPDGQQKVWLLVAPLLDKTYATSPAPAESASQREDKRSEEAAQQSDGRVQYDSSAVKDCVAIMEKLTREGMAYLNSTEGKGFLTSLKTKPPGHALRLFAENWDSPERAGDEGAKQSQQIGKMKASVQKRKRIRKQAKADRKQARADRLAADAELKKNRPIYRIRVFVRKQWKKMHPGPKENEGDLGPQDGGVLSMIMPLLDKTYSNPLPTEQKSSDKSKAAGHQGFSNKLDQYDPAAVKDCFGIIGKLTTEAKTYLASQEGKALVGILGQLPEGHAGRLLAESWRVPEALRTNEQLKTEISQKWQLAQYQKIFGPKTGQKLYDLLKKNTSKEALTDDISDGVKTVSDPLWKGQEKKIEGLSNDPNYTSQMAQTDKKNLSNARGMLGEIVKDYLKLPVPSWSLGTASRLLKNPYLLEALAIGVVNPTASKLPGAGKTSSPLEAILGDFMSKKAEQSASVSVGTDKSRFQGNVKAGTNPLRPDDILSGAAPFSLDLLNKLSGGLTFRPGKGREMNTKNEFVFKSPGTPGSAVSSAKGSFKVDSKNKLAEKNFVAETTYEYQPTALKMNGIQTFDGQEGSITFAEGYAVDQNGTKTTFGADIKSGIFTERFKVNLPKNTAKQHVDETAVIGLGFQPREGASENADALSFDANVTLNLAGEDHVKALAGFLQYKDPKHFLEGAIGYQRERTGQVNTADLALALKKTWHDVSVYLAGSFGMTGGKPARGNIVAGTEIKLGSSPIYKIFGEAEFKQTGLPGSSDVYTGTAGVVRDKIRLGAYYSNDAANRAGVKASLTFDPAAFVKLFQTK